MQNTVVNIIGAGLAGCEAALYLAEHGVHVVLCEMKPYKFTPAHKNENFAELVCSNSLKSKLFGSAGGLLKSEMRLLGSAILPVADKTAVPAGGALAVDRNAFAAEITKKILAHPLIKVEYKEIVNIAQDNFVIIATGPLTSKKLSDEIKTLCSAEYLNFYDAAAPIVTHDSLNKEIVFFASRYNKGGEDYINCPFEKDEYMRFYTELVSAQCAPLHEFDVNPKVYEGCMPIETLAKRGVDSIRYGPLKPVGIFDPKSGKRPWAVVQLRAENSQKSLYNLVGFQTNLKFFEQKRVFSLIPGLENAEFVRYGVMHRNTFINSPTLLNSDFSMKKNDKIFFAGQITGVEGYMESAASGILSAIGVLRKLNNKPPLTLPKTTMLGALSRYISDESVKNFQPMGANMGLLPPLDVIIKSKKERYEAIAQRSIHDFEKILENFDI